MSSRSSRDAADRALRALSREAADVPLPSIDWDRIEQAVFADVATEGERLVDVRKPAVAVVESSVAARRRSGSPWTIGLAAAAAALLVVGTNLDAGRSPASAPALGVVGGASSLVRGVTLGDSLEVGGVVVAKVQPLTYVKAGLATFTVAVSSRVQLVAAERDGARPGAVTIALAEGSVHAEVQPQAEGEAFAVEVDQTRIAVHGTSFTVTRAGDRVLVEVVHGSVAVGPAGHPGSTHRWLLVGPDRASFSLDGASDARWLPVAEEPSVAEPLRSASIPSVASDRATAHDAADAVKARKSALSAPSTRASAGRAEISDRAGVDGAEGVERAQAATTLGAAEQEEIAKAAISRGLEACYEKQLGAFGVSFSIQSSLSLSILPSGAVREGLFNPPLSPTLLTCARDAITRAHFAPGDAVRRIQLPVNLSRP